MINSAAYPILNYHNLLLIPYGSTIRGTNTDSSDFDVLVVCDFVTFNNYKVNPQRIFFEENLYDVIKNYYLKYDTNVKIDLTLAYYSGDLELKNRIFHIYQMYNEQLNRDVSICPDYINYELSIIYEKYGDELLNYIRNKKRIAHETGDKRNSIQIELDAVLSFTAIDIPLII